MLIQSNIRQCRLRYLDDLRAIMPDALRENFDAGCDGSAPYFCDFSVAAYDITHEHRLMELHGIHCNGDNPAFGATMGFDATGDVDLGDDPAAENVTCSIDVGGHRHQAQRGLAIFGQGGMSDLH